MFARDLSGSLNPRAFLLALVLPFASCSTEPLLTPQPFTAPGVDLLALNPWATRQRTPSGRRIQTVEYFAEQVYVGFGDWRANTGPIAVTSWDLANSSWTLHFHAGTEALERIRALPSGLLLPYTDPNRRVDFARGPEWEERKALLRRRESFYHVFDAAETADGLFLVGTRQGSAEPLVLRLDGEQWQESLRLEGKVDWLWFAAVLDGELVVQSETQGSYRYHKGNWEAVPDLFADPRARAVVSVGPRVAGITREATHAGFLQVSDGSTHWLDAVGNALDLNIDQATGWVYLLRPEVIERSRDLLTWETLPVTVPPGASALDVADGRVWVGTDEGALWALSLP